VYSVFHLSASLHITPFHRRGDSLGVQITHVHRSKSYISYFRKFELNINNFGTTNNHLISTELHLLFPQRFNVKHYMGFIVNLTVFATVKFWTNQLRVDEVIATSCRWSISRTRCNNNLAPTAAYRVYHRGRQSRFDQANESHDRK